MFVSILMKQVVLVLLELELELMFPDEVLYDFLVISFVLSTDAY